MKPESESEIFFRSFVGESKLPSKQKLVLFSIAHQFRFYRYSDSVETERSDGDITTSRWFRAVSTENSKGMGMDDSNLLVQCDFEVFGQVQGTRVLRRLKFLE